jgi:hypothetical protein
MDFSALSGLFRWAEEFGGDATVQQNSAVADVYNVQGHENVNDAEGHTYENVSDGQAHMYENVDSATHENVEMADVAIQASFTDSLPEHSYVNVSLPEDIPARNTRARLALKKILK